MKFFISKIDLKKLESGYAGHATVSSYQSHGMVEVKSDDGLTKGTLATCRDTWLESIKALGSARTFIIPSEEQLIARAIQNNGFETVELALFGARFEPAIENFDPRNHIDIARILLPDKQNKPRIQKFVEFGAKGLARENAKENKRTAMAAEPDAFVEPSSEVKAMLQAAGFGSIVKGMP